MWGSASQAGEIPNISNKSEQSTEGWDKGNQHHMMRKIINEEQEKKNFKKTPKQKKKELISPDEP